MTGNILATRYELVEQLAEGVLFSVYRARDLMRSQVVTVKMVRSPYAQNSLLRERLLQLAETRKRLQHPNLATLIAIELDEAPPFLVEEFLRALDLQTRIRRTAPFTIPIAVEIMIGIVEGVEALHRAGLVHTDLRPANVLIGSEWHVWLNGIGMRSVYQADPALWAEHESRSVAYTAPEVLQGGMPSVASDIYACGVIFYEMLTARPPFGGETLQQAREAHLNAPIPSLRDDNPAVPRAVEGIVMKCLQKDPNARYPTALSLLNDLKGVRDALRFGKPLGWSPMDLQATSIEEKFKARPTPVPTSQVAEPEEEEEDEIPRWLRTMLRVMTALVVAGLIILGAGWLALRMVPEDRPIPPVIGKPLQEVNRILIEQGFEPEVRQEGYSEEYPPGVVYSVSPPEGRVVRKGTKVYLWVSKGSRMVQLPDVRNLPEARARAELEQFGISVLSTAEERRSDTVPFGYVIDTIPPPGTRIDRSRPVKLVVSIGMLAGTPSQEPTDTPPSTPEKPESPKPTGTVPREFVVKVDLTDQPDRQVRVEVQDAEGMRTVVDEIKSGGQLHEITVRATGAPVRIRVYIDNQLVQEINR